MTEPTTGRGTGTPGTGRATASRARPGRPDTRAPSERFAAAMAVARSAASSSPTVTAPRKGTGKVRKARLRVSHIDPWSVMKTSFLLSVALGIVTVVAVAVIWSL